MMRHTIALLLLAMGGLTRAGQGWLEAPGGAFGADSRGAKSGPQDQSREWMLWRKDGDNIIVRELNFPTRGIWYLWVKASNPGFLPALVGYDLDGIQPLKSARKEFMLQPFALPAWISASRFPGFKLELNVDEPGKHLLRLTQLRGNASVEKLMLTLYYSAKLKGDGLDMAGDPGRGRTEFPSGAPSRDGFRKDWISPEIRASGKSYHVDAEKGDDAWDGSASKPWKSLAKVNTAPLKGGDAVLLKRGGHWLEPLAPRGSGTAAAWITLGAYGKGERPWINGVARPGLSLKDQSYWSVQDLQLTSDPEYGVPAFEAGVSEKMPRARGLRVLNCLAFDSGGHGISVGGYMGYDGVLIENCLSFQNSGDGIQVGGGTQKGSARNIVIRHCTAYSNPGMAGIWIESAENGLIEDCLAYNNACVNIWCWNAANITMRRCEVFRGRPPRDAAGFDIDYGSEGCTLEQCYSHHNEGDAFLLMGSGNLAYLGYTMQSNYNLMRYCVAEGRSCIDMGETFNHSLVHNNLSVAYGSGAHAFTVFGWPNRANGGDGGWPEDTRVLNNVFVGLEGAGALLVDGPAVKNGNVYDSNLLWAQGGPLIHWGGQKNGPHFWDGNSEAGSSPPMAYADLASFQKATGLGRQSLQADPKLASPGAGGYGRLPLATARLAAGSPAFGKGKAIALDEAWLKARRKFMTETGAEAYGIPMEPAQASEDYWGKKLNAESRPIGAQEP
jgi:hypothetical protein